MPNLTFDAHSEGHPAVTKFYARMILDGEVVWSQEIPAHIGIQGYTDDPYEPSDPLAPADFTYILANAGWTVEGEWEDDGGTWWANLQPSPHTSPEITVPIAFLARIAG